MEGCKSQLEHLLYQIFAVLQRHRAGQQRRAVNMFELPLCAATAKAYGKPPPESQKRILQADGMSGIKSKNRNGLKTLLIIDGARCYPSLARKKSLLHLACSHSKGLFSPNKRLPKRGWTKIHTGTLDGFWRGAKKTIPDSLPSKSHGKRNVNICKSLIRYQWRWNCTGQNLMKRTAATFEDFVQQTKFTRRVFGPKVVGGFKTKTSHRFFDLILIHKMRFLLWSRANVG